MTSRPQVLDRRDQPVGLVARVDDDRLARAVARGEEAVLGDGADGEAVDVHDRQLFGLFIRLYIQLSNM